MGRNKDSYRDCYSSEIKKKKSKAKCALLFFARSLKPDHFLASKINFA